MGARIQPALNTPLMFLCHGTLHRKRLPHHMNESLTVDWDKAITLDLNPMALPDVHASMLDRAVTTSVPVGSLGLLIPIYCVSDVYGTWDAPNPVFFRAASRWLRPGGHVVVNLPRRSMLDTSMESRVHADLEVIETLFEARLPPSLSGAHVYPVIDALQAAETAADRARIFQALTVRLPEAKSAIAWLRRRYARCTRSAGTLAVRRTTHPVTSLSDARKRVEFATRVSSMTGNRLIRVPGRALVKKGSESIVFVKISR